MDRRRLIGGLAAVLLVAGLLLACFAAGGWFNRQEASIDTPIGSITVSEERTVWPIVGYTLAGAGAVGLAVAFALDGTGKP